MDIPKLTGGFDTTFPKCTYKEIVSFHCKLYATHLSSWFVMSWNIRAVTLLKCPDSVMCRCPVL